MATNTESTAEPSSATPRRLLYARIVQNFHLVWLDRKIDETDDNCRNSLTKLREVVSMVNTFVDINECADFITNIPEKAFMVISEEFTQDIITILQGISQVHSIFIYSRNNVPYKTWNEESLKVAGAYSDVTSICEALRKATRNYNHNSVPFSYIKKIDNTANRSLDTLDPSFMYTQILKEIILAIDFEPVHFNEFITYCRKLFVDSKTEIANVEKIEKEYRRREPIWWYTATGFLYSMLNTALRTMEADLIVNMGFFVRDLHDQIAKLHTEQYGTGNLSDSVIVYRGQSLSETEFNQLKTTQGGLISFNNFLSTSLDRETSLGYAQSNRNKPDFIGVLFEIQIEPSTTSTPFANVKEISPFEEEEEILFSMHSVFRIGEVKQIEENDRLWQVKLTQTTDNDPQLQALTDVMRYETEGLTEWFRLGRLMMKVAQYDKAEQLFKTILDQTTDAWHKSTIYHYLGWIKDDQGNYTEAIAYYEKSLEIKQNIFPENRLGLATSYNNIALVYDKTGEYSKAFSYYERTLKIQEETLPADHSYLATSYNNIGLLCDKMGNHSKALLYYEKALEIKEKILLSNHPDLAISYNQIGAVYDSIGEYPKALSYYEKAIEIKQKSLPASHPSLATSYNNIGLVYDTMSEYSKALLYYEKALEIRQKILPENHPDLAASYCSIGGVYDKMGEYPEAISSHEKALQIRQQTLSANHPDLANSYNNIGAVYHNMGEYSRAVSYYEKALKIREKTLPDNHSDLAVSYNNIGATYLSMGEQSKALPYFVKTLKIRQKTLSEDHPDLAQIYNNIGTMYLHMGKHVEALPYYEKARGILQKTLPADHSDLGRCYNNIGMVYGSMHDHSKALSYYEKALAIFEITLSSNHPDLVGCYAVTSMSYLKMGDYSNARLCCERGWNIAQHSLSPDHPCLLTLKMADVMLKMVPK